MKDYIIIITAIIGAVLGIINLILNIHKGIKENIKIYNDRLSIEYQFSFLESCYRESYWIIPLKMDYILYVLNNKNRAVFIENISWYFQEEKEKYYFSNSNLFRPKSLNFSVNTHDMKRIEDCVEFDFYINKKALDHDAHYVFTLCGILYLSIDGRIYKKDVRIYLQIDYIKKWC